MGDSRRPPVSSISNMTRMDHDEIQILLSASGRVSFDGRAIRDTEANSFIAVRLDAHGQLVRVATIGPGRERGNIVTVGDGTVLVTAQLKAPPSSPFDLVLAPKSWAPDPNSSDNAGSQCVLIRAMEVRPR